MRVSVFLSALLLLFEGLNPGPAAAQAGGSAGMMIGPMVAGVEPTTASVWVYTTTRAPLWAEAVDTLGGAPIRTPTQLRRAPTADSLLVLRFAGLRPATEYRYTVWAEGRPAGGGRFRTPPADTATVDFTFALGSCAFIHEPYRPEGYGIFERIHAQHPDLMVWLGDNVYLWKDEWTSAARATRRYAYTRAVPAMQPLLANAAQVAIWDDHDFGPNNANGSLPTSAAMREVFRRFWPHDHYEAPPGGATGQFRWGDAEFFLLDDRTWRTPRRTPRRARTQLGAAQRAWLLHGLATSTATFKFVAVGGQFLSSNSRGETFANGFGRERTALLRALDSLQIPNVVFLTGDRHFAELSRRQERGALPLYDLTASPLTAGPARPRGRNRHHVPGTLIRGYNFATVRVAGPAGARQLTLTGFDAAGQPRWQHVVRAEPTAARQP